jgi:vacuolar-type H+-ATPase subunit E/Vma4
MADMKALVDAVMSEVERDRERIISHAKSEAQSTIERAHTEASSARNRILQEAEKKVKNHLVEVRATANLEAQSIKLEKRESLINRVFDQAAQRLTTLHQVEDYQRAVHALIEDAVVRMENVDTLVVDTDAVTHELLDQNTLTKLSRDWNCRLMLGEVLAEGTGVIVRSLDGRMVYDNTFQARLVRLKPSLRSPVYQILKGQNS